MKGIVGFVVFSVVALAAAKPQKAASEPVQDVTANQPTNLAELISNAQANINNIGKQIQEQLNIPDQTAVVNTIKTQSANLVNNVQTFMSQVSEDIKAKSPELERLWDDMKGKLSKAVDGLNAQIPNAQEQAAQLEAKFTEGVNVLVKESEKAAKTISQNSSKAQEDIAKFTKQAVEIAVQATQNLNTQLQQAAAPKAA